jgi:uncharacterized protein (TIGR03437 family)
MVNFPAVLPEVTGAGGTEFVEGTGTYWASTNSANFGSALSYIPEAAWNESSAAGLGAGGGGASLFYSRPSWQTGPGVPNDTARHVPDVALTAAIHDASLITFQGANLAVAGTSAVAPSLAGIVALLNQYQVTQGFQAAPGLGNINPQLYRLAETMPSAFHDITTGNNIVPCAQGSPDCLTGSFGYTAGPGYDMATGLGSVDANTLVTQWNKQSAGVTVALASASRASLNDTVTATATVSAQPGAPSAAPTGTVYFSIAGIALGSASLTSGGTASLSFPVYQLGAGAFILSAVYSGDTVFSSGGATKLIEITAPASASAIVPSGPNTVWASPPDAEGLSWQTTLSLQDASGVPALLTGFSIDGQTQTLSQYFPSPDIPGNGAIQTTVVFRNLTTPLTRTFAFTGIDATGQSWSRQLSVRYESLLPLPNFNLAATPPIVSQNPAAEPSFQWAAAIRVDERGGIESSITGLVAGSVSLAAQIPAIFGTTRLEAWGSLAGTICFSGIVPPASNYIEVELSSGVAQEVAASFTGPPANPVTISANPASLTLATPSAGHPAQTTLAIGISDNTQAWTALVYPANPTTAWLSVSQLSGTGAATITLTATGTGFEPGVYRATIVIQSPNAVPQSIQVPVMFVLGGSSGTVINSVADPATYRTIGSPGMLFSLFGSNLANTTQSASGNPLPYTLAGVRATVNGVGAPVLYVSPNQINIQVPYSVGAGPAVLGVNNNGQIAGFPFQITPAAPGIFANTSGSLVPQASVLQDGIATLFVNGVGDVPELETGFSPSPATPLNSLPAPALPLAVTVGGADAFLQFVGIAPGEFGVAQVNFTVPTSVGTGPQPVIVTVNGVSSLAVNLTVMASATPSAP